MCLKNNKTKTITGRNCQKVDNSELAEANSGQDNGNSEVNSGISGPESSNPAPDDGNDR